MNSPTKPRGSSRSEQTYVERAAFPLEPRSAYWSTHQVLGNLGSGSFGEVWAVRDRQGNISALKQFKRPLDPNTQTEIEMLKTLKDSGIEEQCGMVKFKGAWAIPMYRPNSNGSGKRAPLVPSVEMEWVDGIDLFDFLLPISQRDEAVGDEFVIRILHDLLMQLDCLHSSGIVHRDIKLENVILTPKHRARLIDYGSVCGKTDGPLAACQNQETRGTQGYLPPEVLRFYTDTNKTVEQTAAGDIWALGLLAWQLRNGEGAQTPEGGELSNEYDIAQFLLRAHEMSEGEPLDELIFRMLEPSPYSRPTAEELLEQLKSL